MLEVAVDASDLTLAVEDDGCGLPDDAGFSTAHREGHFGLLGMTERAAAIGARIHIGARPAGPGTLIRLDIPLAALVPERTL